MSLNFVSMVSVLESVRGIGSPNALLEPYDQALQEMMTAIVLAFGVAEFNEKTVVLVRRHERREYIFTDREQYRIAAALFSAMKTAGYGLAFTEAPVQVRQTLFDAEGGGTVCVQQSESTTAFVDWEDLVRFTALLVSRMVEDADVIRIDEVVQKAPDMNVNDLIRFAAQTNRALTIGSSG